MAQTQTIPEGIKRGFTQAAGGALFMALGILALALLTRWRPGDDPGELALLSSSTSSGGCGCGGGETQAQLTQNIMGQYDMPVLYGSSSVPQPKGSDPLPISQTQAYI